MQVLKFGGTSVANAENMNKVSSIVQQALVRMPQSKTIVVVSALGGVTDVLLQSGGMAAAGDESYKELLQKVEQRHLETVKALIPVTQQSSVLSWVKQRCNEIEDICNGVFLLGELSARTKDRIVSFGELLSSKIISAHLNAQGIENSWVDARELIRTDSHYGSAVVDFSVTNTLCSDFFSAAVARLFIVPGFVSADANGNTTIATIIITQPAQLVASASSGSIACFGGVTAVNVSANGGTAP
jgi:aspartokinase/homoserine dehydrogenase 1